MKKNRKQVDTELSTLEGDHIPRPVRKGKGGLRLKAKHHRRLTKVLAASSACAILVGGTFGINALFFNSATPNTVEEGFETVMYAVPTDGSTPDMHSALENIGYMNARFRGQSAWYSQMDGDVNTMLSQHVSTWKQYSDGVLIQTDITTSSLINSALQFCWAGDRVIWREASVSPSGYNGIDTPWKEGEPYGNMSVEDYKKSRGLPGTDFSVYVINEETLLDASPVTDNGDGTYTQTYYLDPATDKAPAYYVNQMMVTGGLNKLPTFEHITVTYTFDSTWQVLSSYIDEAYTATKGLDAKCTANYLTTYEYGTDKAYSDAYESYFKAYADKPATGAPEGGALTAADLLAEAFAPVLTQPVTFAVDLTVDGRELSGLAWVDATDMSDFAMRAQFGSVYAAYEGGNVYLQLGENKVRLDPATLAGLFAGAQGGLELDTDALLEQLGAGTLEQSGDGTQATLASTLSLMGLELPVRFTFAIRDGAISLGEVTTQLGVAGMQIAARLAYSQEDLPARDMSDSADVSGLVASLGELFAGDALSAKISYALQAGGTPLVLDGTLMLDMHGFGVKGELAVAFGEGENVVQKSLSFAYTAAGEGEDREHWVYLSLEGAKFRLNASDALAFLTGILGAGDAQAQFALGDILDKLLSIDLGGMLTVGENSLALMGGELLASLGVDFALGDVTLAATQGGVQVSALGVTAQLSGAQAFTVKAEDYAGYADLTPLLGTAERILADGRIALGGTFSLQYKNTAFTLAVENGVLSWKNGFALSLDLAITVGETRQTIAVDADDARVRIVYGSVGVELRYSELEKLGDTFEEVYARIAAILNRSVSGEGLPATVQALCAQLGAGSAATDLLSSLDLPSLIGGLSFGGATQAEGSFATLCYGGMVFDLRMMQDGLALVLGETSLGDIVLAGTLSAQVAPSAQAPQEGASGLMTVDDLCELLDFAGAAVATLASSDVTISFSGSTTDAAGGKVFDLSGELLYHSGAESGTLPVFVDAQGQTITVNPDAYVYFALTLDEIAEGGTDLYLEFWMLDAHDDGELDFFVSISKYPEGDANYQPLRFAVGASDILTILASGVSLTQDTLAGFLKGLELPEQTVDTLFAALDNFFVSKWLSDTDKAQLSALGGVLMSTLGIDAAIEDMLGGLADSVGGLTDDVTAVDPGKYLSELGIRRGEDGSVTFFVVLNSDLVYGGQGLAPLSVSLSKREGADGSRLAGVSLANIRGNGNRETTGVDFAFTYDALTLSGASDASASIAFAGGTRTLTYSEYEKYTFSGVDELIRSIAATATHEEDDGYRLNDDFFVSGTATLEAFGIFNVTVRIDGISFRVDEKGNVLLNAKIGYDSFVGVINGRSDIEMTVAGGMVYMRRTQYEYWWGLGFRNYDTPVVVYRVMPLSNFMADIMNQLAFMLNLSDSIASRMTSSGSSTEDGAPVTDDYGVILYNYLKEYSFSRREDNTGAQWRLAMNGGYLTDDIFSDIVVSLTSENYAGKDNILRALNVTTSLNGSLNITITADLGMRNACGVWEEGYSDVTADLAQELADAGDAISSFDWTAQAAGFYLEPQRTTVNYSVAGEPAGSQSVWYSGSMLLTPLSYPSLEGLEKEGYTLAWKPFSFTPNGTAEAVYTPDLYDVTIIAPVNIGGDWTDNGDGSYSFTTQMYYGETLTLTWGDKSHVYTVGTQNNVFDLRAPIGEDNVLWAQASADILTAGSSVKVPLTPDEVVYTSSGVAFTIENGTAPVSEATASFDAQYTLAQPAAEGYVFLGWFIREGDALEKVTQLSYQGGGVTTTVSALWASDITSGSIAATRSGSVIRGYSHTASASVAGGKLVGEYASQFEVSGSAALRVKWNLNYYDLSSPSVSQTAEGWSTGSATGKSSIVAAPNVYADITLAVALDGRTIATLKASLVAEYIDNGANVEQQSFEFSAEIE